MAKKRQYEPLEQKIRDSFQARKRLFIGLIIGSSILVSCLLALIWIVPVVGLSSIHPAVPWIFGVIVGLLILGIGWSALALVLNVLLGRPVLFSKPLRGMTIKLFYR